MENQVPDNKLNLNTIPVNMGQLNKSEGLLSCLNIFKKNKLYLFIVIAIILAASVLYYLYIKNKEKKKAKLEGKNKNKMMDIIDMNDKTNEKLLFNPVDKQYYTLDSSGDPIKTTLEIYKKKNSQQMEQQQMERKQIERKQMEQQRMAQQQMEQQRMAQQQMEQQKMKMNKNKLKHQVESESDDETSDNIVYDVNQIDNDLNISQYNLNSDDMNEINSKLSENN